MRLILKVTLKTNIFMLRLKNIFFIKFGEILKFLSKYNAKLQNTENA